VLELITKLHPTKQYLCEIKADISSIPFFQRDVVNSGATPSQVKFIGFAFETMVDIKRALPAFSSVYIVEQQNEQDVMTAIYRASEAKLDGVDFAARPDSVTVAAVDAAHALNLEVLVWVCGKAVDNSVYWDKLQENGVNVYTSDLPGPIFDWMAQNIKKQLFNKKLTRCLGCNTKLSSDKTCPKCDELTPKRDVSGSLIKRLITSAYAAEEKKDLEGSSVECFSTDTEEGTDGQATKLLKCS
jgi:hypothetical protein